MAPNYQSPSVTTGAPTSHANESVTSPSTHPLNQPEGPVGNGPFPESGQHVPPSPAPEVPPYTERDMEVAGPGSTTPPPPSYAESTLELIIGDAKTPPCVDDSPLPPLYDLPSPHKRDVGGLLSVVSPEEPILLRVGDSPLLPHLCFLSKASADTNLPSRRYVTHTVTIMPIIPRRRALSRRGCLFVAPPPVH